MSSLIGLHDTDKVKKSGNIEEWTDELLFFFV